jgi:hypothetical protein
MRATVDAERGNDEPVHMSYASLRRGDHLQGLNESDARMCIVRSSATLNPTQPRLAPSVQTLGKTLSERSNYLYRTEGTPPELPQKSTTTVFTVGDFQVLRPKDNARGKTYNRRDSQMVTHSSTSRPVQCLCMAERTGCPVFTDLWSYVLDGHGFRNI